MFIRTKKTIGVVLLSIISLTMSCAQKNNDKAVDKKQAAAVQESLIEVLTTATFKEKIYDYTASPNEFVYKGKLPCIIDFYATWCGPCRLLAPRLEEAASTYKGKIKVYKVDVDQNKELSQVFGVSSIPFILFIPKTGKPSAQAGLLQKEQIDNIVKDVLLKEETK